MSLSQKDKSLILLIAVVLIVLWAVFSSFSTIFFSSTFNNSKANNITYFSSDDWLNTSDSLKTDNIKNRIILLDFWNYSCVSCIQALPHLKKLQERFGDKLLIIAVHSKSFDNEKDISAIRKSVLKHNITYPVINDHNLSLAKAFEVKSWPQFTLLDPHGDIYSQYNSLDSFLEIKKDVKKLIKKFKFRLNRQPLPILLEKNSIISNVLNFPTKMAYVKKFSLRSPRHYPVIFISNSGDHNIIVSNLSGNIVTEIGSKKPGFKDGDFDEASFNYPQGLVFDSATKKLYVADLGNNALRLVDFKKETVTTLIGSSKRGKIIKDNNQIIAAKDFDLSAPSDVKFFPSSDKKSLVIANSGANQILKYNLAKKTISLLAGSGDKGLKDGVKNNAILAQSRSLAVFKNEIYFIDSASSSLRKLDKKGKVTTLIGKGLNSFGHKNGTKDQALMQNPTDLYANSAGIYIVDSFNHSIRKYDFSSKKIKDIIGSKNKGDALGKGLKIKLNEPAGIVSSSDNFYIADSANNRILSVGRSKLEAKILDVIPALKLPKEGFLEYLPNLTKSETIKVKSNSKLKIEIKLNKGWKINKSAPTFINLLKVVSKKEANLIANFDWQQIENKNLNLPKLKSGKDYVLQGTIYYCEDKENALCYIKSYQQNLSPDSDSKETIIKLEVGHS